MMAYKDPPKDKSMNAPACSTILVAALAVGTALTALVGAGAGWWA